ncbi:MAG: hypothetical protein QM737_22025 [Ferruginibacter sp.]
MNKQITSTSWLLTAAAVTFWISWLLMPDPGTTDTTHILSIVKQSRMNVICSVTVQIISSVLYVLALFSLTKTGLVQRKISWIGISLLGIGAMGLCADAFFHLLAWYMTDSSVTIQEDVICVMEFMQTSALIFLVPLLLPLFIGSLLLSIGLKKQSLTSGKALYAFIISLFVGPATVIIMKKAFQYEGTGLSMIILGIFALGQVFMAIELKKGSALKPRFALPVIL